MTWPAAVLWDLDGTLFDTETQWGPTEKALAVELGGRLPEDHQLETVGGTVSRTADYIRERTPTAKSTDEIVDLLWQRMIDHLAGREVPWLPGVPELVAAFAEQGTPQAIVTSSIRRYADGLLSRVPDHPFVAVVAGDDVAEHKPHPQPYLQACGLLGVAPQQCLVIEDSLSGATAGRAAGCAVVLVPSFGDPQVPGAVRLDTLAGVTIGRLAQLVGRAD